MRVVFALVAAMALSAGASPVEIGEAAAAASNWVATVRSPESRGPSTVLKVVRYGAFYLASCSDGSVLVISSDSSNTPVPATLLRACDPVTGEITLDKRHPAWDVLGGGNPSAGKPLLAAKRGLDDNGKDWEFLLRRTPRKGVLSASAVMVPDVNVLPGFEDGGPLTHWNQTYAVKDGASGSDVKPVYNYYLYDAAHGGSDEHGLKFADGPGDWPCGCGNTAFAAAAQYYRFAGIKDDPYAYSDRFYVDEELVTNRFWVIPGRYDWDMLPSNYGGTGAVATASNPLSDEARELLGRVTYNYMIYNNTVRFAKSGTGVASPDMNVEFPSASPVGGYSRFVLSTLDLAHVNWYPWDLIHEMPKGGPDSPEGMRCVSLTSTDVINRLRAPVVFGDVVYMSIRGSAGGHAILAVGQGWQTRPGSGVRVAAVKLFMGWSGSGDMWLSSDGAPSGFTGLYAAFVPGGTNANVKFVYAPVARGTANLSTGESMYGIPFTLSVVGNEQWDPDYDPEDDYVISVATNSLNEAFVAIRPKVAITNRVLNVSRGLFLKARTSPFTFNGNLYSASSTTAQLDFYLRCTHYDDEYPSGGYDHTTCWFYDSTLNHSASLSTSFMKLPELGFSVSKIGDAPRRNGFDYGTFDPFDDVLSASVARQAPIVVITGVDGFDSVASASLKNGPGRHYATNCVTYFLDIPGGGSQNIDGTNSVVVLDPRKVTGISSDIWNMGGDAFLSYGNFADPDDVADVVRKGLEKFRDRLSKGE